MTELDLDVQSTSLLTLLRSRAHFFFDCPLEYRMSLAAIINYTITLHPVHMINYDVIKGVLSRGTE